MTKNYLQVGDRVRVQMPWSEVCIHMRIADKVMLAELLSEWSVQLYELNGKPFSAPITTGEAGFYHDNDGVYCYLTICTGHLQQTVLFGD